ncbi:MAG: signal recognition particle-docking protein FtsY [Candidatus Binatia bacterium]
MAGHELLVALVTMGAAIAVGLLVALPLGRWQLARTPAAAVPGAAPPARSPWVSGLAKTRGNLARRLLDAWSGGADRDAWLHQVEEILLSSDVGVKATQTLIAQWRREVHSGASPAEVRQQVCRAVRDLLAAPAAADHGSGPLVMLVVGVNGVGKTTTIGKLAHRYRRDGRSVLLVAGDTFRAAAIEQLTLWAARVGADLVKHQHGADPSAVVFDGIQAALARAADVVIIDTAGRLHVKANLMEEVKKIARTTARLIPAAPHQVLLVIDATSGQNALTQARVFHEALGVTAVALTKLDGTAKGGVALAIRSELGLPIRYIGLGEQPDDLAPFDADAFAAALFSEDERSSAA